MKGREHGKGSEFSHLAYRGPTKKWTPKGTWKKKTILQEREEGTITVITGITRASETSKSPFNGVRGESPKADGGVLAPEREGSKSQSG